MPDQPSSSPTSSAQTSSKPGFALLSSAGLTFAALGVVLVGALAWAGQVTPSEKPGEEAGEVPREMAVEFVKQVLMVVDAQGLLPQDRTRYDATRAALQRTVDEATGPTMSRAVLYKATRQHLRTLDADGHTLLWSQAQAQGWDQSTSPQAAAAASTVQRVETRFGVVLVFRPAQATFMGSVETEAYARDAAAQIAKADAAPRPCALVVDLDDQKGGNAWPVIQTMHDVFTPGNQARLVDGRGRRTPIVKPWTFMHNPTFARFAGTPVGVVMSAQTASAGEMLAVMLKGEAGVKTFGQASYGMTTANQTLFLADQARLLLSVSRYAQGDAEPVRGPLQPDVAVPTSEHQSRAVLEAAEWAASQAPACKAAT